jgi:hypothetical protein
MRRRFKTNEEKNKMPYAKINYVYESISLTPDFIKYRYSEHINTLNIFGNVHRRTGHEGPEGE